MSKYCLRLYIIRNLNFPFVYGVGRSACLYNSKVLDYLLVQSSCGFELQLVEGSHVIFTIPGFFWYPASQIYSQLNPTLATHEPDRAPLGMSLVQGFAETLKTGKHVYY